MNTEKSIIVYFYLIIEKLKTEMDEKDVHLICVMALLDIFCLNTNNLENS